MSGTDTDGGEVQVRSHRKSLGVIALGAALGVLTIFIYSHHSETWALFSERVAIGLAVAGAAFMMGGLSGFLFGIPRRLQRDASTKKEASGVEEDGVQERTLYEGNTNLEQISDWLTKILVGVGLVQLTEIIGALDGYGQRVATSLGDQNDASFAVAIILYFFVCGFLLGYLWARLFLGQALTEAETRVRLERKLNRLERQTQADALAIALARRQLAGDENEIPKPEDLVRAFEAASNETKSHLFYQAENQRWKNWQSNKAAMERAIPIFRALVATDRADKYHRNLGQLAYALKDKRDPDWDEAEGLFTRAIASRGSAASSGWSAYEANRAICRIMMADHFRNRFGSDQEAIDAIMSDLRVAAKDVWVRPWLGDDPTVKDWLRSNSLEFPSAL